MTRTKESTAVATLERMGFTWSGGELWKPPLGVPAIVKVSPPVKVIDIELKCKLEMD